MFVNNESTAGVGNDKPVSILSDHFILSCTVEYPGPETLEVPDSVAAPF